MRQLLDILSVFKEYLVLAACILGSAALLAMNDNAQMRSLRSIAIVVIGAVQDAAGIVPNYFSLREENSILRERNVALADEVSLLRESRLENVRLRKLVGLKERTPFKYIAANVIGKNAQPMRNTVTLDVGSDDGVKYNMPVVTDAGLAGRIVGTSGKYSVAQLLMHKDMRVSVRVQRVRADGILYWDGEQFHLKNVPRTQDVQKGDAVVTSSFSTIFPAGIKIGIVSSATIEPAALFQTITVEPVVEFSKLEEVFILADAPDSARVALEQQFNK